MSNGISVGAIIFIAVKPIVKIYIIMFLGWVLVKKNILSMETSRGISNMVVNAILPCLTFNKIVTNLSGSQIKEIGVMILSIFVIFGTGGALAALATLITPVPKKWVWGLIFGGIFANIGDLPIAYVQSMGTGIVFDSKEMDKGVALSCISLVCQQFFIMNLGMFQLVGLDFREPKKKDEEASLEDKENDESNSKQQEKDEDFTVKPLQADYEEDVSDDTSQRSYSTRRRRRSSAVSGAQLDRIRTGDSIYSSRSKRQPQDIKAIIGEYSEADRIRSHNLDLAKTVSKTQEIGLNIDADDDEPTPNRYRTFIQKYNLGWLDYMIVNLARPASVVLIISLIVTMVPWLRALFVNNSIDVHSAPDELPPLSFVMDFTSYLGVASIPMGLLLLGGTIARLEINEIPKGFWKTSLFLTLCRLVVMPVLGILWTNRLYSAGLIDDDISRFVIMISWSVPSATAQVYFTAFYTPLEGDHIQMDCLAIFLLMQYPLLAITLAITVCYVLKVNLGY